MRLIHMLRSLGRPAAALWADLRGATLVQFIAVLPVFVLMIYGAWSVSVVMGAHTTLCEAAHESARYLQVEGPRFPDDDPNYAYPDGWRRVAFQIAQPELQSHKRLREAAFQETNITIWPAIKPVAPTGPDQVSPELVTSSLFTVRVDAEIANPLYLWFDGLGAAGKLAMRCQATGFFEGPPFRTTADDPAGGDRCERERNSRACQRPPRCTAGPPPTECSGPDCPTPVCCPCQPR